MGLGFSEIKDFCGKRFGGASWQIVLTKTFSFKRQTPKGAASFYVDNLGFEITEESDNMISLHGDQINLFIERGPTLGPVFEVIVDDLEQAKLRLIKHGAKIVKDEPTLPRCYIQDKFGLIYNLTS